MAAVATPTVAALPQRLLGSTGERVPILGIGTGPGGMGLADDDAVRLYHAALDRGVTYIDTAPGYARAQAQLGEVLATRRHEAFIVTKTFAATADEALSILAQTRQDLRTEHVDLTYIHCVGSFDPDALLGKGGALEGLREAQRRGWTRFVGFTAHHAPWKAERLLREAAWDAVMLAMNFVDRHTYNFEGRIAPLAATHGVGVVLMKAYGGAKDMKYETPAPSTLGRGEDHRLALRYALGLPHVTTAVVGMYTERELDENLRWAREFTPLTEAEAAQLDARGRELAAQWGPHFGELE